MAFYVVNTRREFTQAQLIHITDNGMGRVDFMEARWQALPGAKSLIARDCEHDHMALSSRFIDWWMERPLIWLVIWPTV